MDPDLKDLFCARMTAPLLGTVLDEVLAKADNYLKSKMESEEITETAFFVVGSKKTGKSTLIIDAFELNSNDARRTLTLDFFCALRLAEDGITQKMCSIWELCGGTSYAAVLNTLQWPKHLSTAIMLDLSKPHQIVDTLTASLDMYHKYFENKYKGDKKLERQVPELVKDREMITPFPVPLFIVGGMYDAFQEFEPEKKKVVCQYLRYVAHINYGFLFFYSNKMNNLSKVGKEIFNNHFFGIPTTYTKIFDYNHPLLIPNGTDSLKSIDGDLDDASDGIPSFEKYIHLVNSYFNKENSEEQKKYPDNPRYDPNYKEPKIDNLRNQKDEILEKLIAEKRMELKLKYDEIFSKF